jgi:glycosyltransferase involved in cell wall biosynthesis
MSAPDVDVLVPVQNEAALVARKIRNLQQIAYPGGLHVWIVDGRSTDATVSAAGQAAGDDPRFAVLSAGVADKTAQLNLGLRQGTAPWVLVTDADAEM